METKADARAAIEHERERLLDLSHAIHADPEILFQEHRSAARVANALERAGFTVERAICDLPTAFRATAGSGPLHVAFCAEYDALPSLGHACGHNVIASAAVGAAIGAAAVADAAGMTVTVVGTPAEEGGGGKQILLDRGGFDGVHAALMVHPMPFDMVEAPLIAAQTFDVRFTGKESHAAALPEAGINAADAMTIAQVALGLLRQHVPADRRFHGIVTKGGDAPNVIPADTRARWMVRTQRIEDLGELRERVLRCFEAGALATGATLDVSYPAPAYADMRHDHELAEAYARNAEALGRVFPDPDPIRVRMTVSSDMGNVSRAIPSIHPDIGIDAWPAMNHQPEFAAACATPSADRAVIDGAIALAWTAIDAATVDGLRSRLLGSGGYRHEARSEDGAGKESA